MLRRCSSFSRKWWPPGQGDGDCGIVGLRDFGIVFVFVEDACVRVDADSYSYDQQTVFIRRNNSNSNNSNESNESNDSNDSNDSNISHLHP